MESDFKSSFKKDFRANRWLILAVVAGSVVLLIRTGWQQSRLTKAFKETCEQEKQLTIHERVSTASFDGGKPSKLTIRFQDSSVFQPVNTKLWQSVSLSPGDSISKLAGGFSFTVFHSGKPPEVISDSQDCDEVLNGQRKNR